MELFDKIRAVLLPIGNFSFLRSEIRRDLERERRSVVVPEWAVVHSEVSCSDWLLVSLAALCDLNIFLQKSFLPSRAPGICSSLEVQREGETEGRILRGTITLISSCILLFWDSTRVALHDSLFKKLLKKLALFMQPLSSVS